MSTVSTTVDTTGEEDAPGIPRWAVITIIVVSIIVAVVITIIIVVLVRRAANKRAQANAKRFNMGQLEAQRSRLYKQQE